MFLSPQYIMHIIILVTLVTSASALKCFKTEKIEGHPDSKERQVKVTCPTTVKRCKDGGNDCTHEDITPVCLRTATEYVVKPRGMDKVYFTLKCGDTAYDCGLSYTGGNNNCNSVDVDGGTGRKWDYKLIECCCTDDLCNAGHVTKAKHSFPRLFILCLLTYLL